MRREPVRKKTNRECFCAIFGVNSAWVSYVVGCFSWKSSLGGVFENSQLLRFEVFRCYIVYKRDREDARWGFHIQVTVAFFSFNFIFLRKLQQLHLLQQFRIQHKTDFYYRTISSWEALAAIFLCISPTTTIDYE